MTEGNFPKPDSIQGNKGGEMMETSKTDMDQPWARRAQGIKDGEFTPAARIRRTTDRTKAQLRRPANLPPGEPKPLGQSLRREYLKGLRRRG